MPRQQTVRRFIGVVAFIAIGLLLYQLASAVLSPYQSTSIMTDKAESFDSEPKNTVEVVFLGSSATANGYIPTQLYEEYGICAYNLGTSDQPMLGSLELAEKAYWAHPRSLRTIVLDCSTLFFECPDAFYRLVLDEVPLPLKYGTVMGWEGSGDDKMVYLSNVYAYHNRWSELDERDLAKFGTPTHPYLRGYEPLWSRLLTESDTSVLSLPRRQPDLRAEPTAMMEDQLRYFDELARFCEERDIALVLCKTPVFDHWSDGMHNAAMDLAGTYGLRFLDCNYRPFFRETGYNQALDTRDGYHSNDSGAAKLTSHMGAYLVENGLASDVRGDPAYAYLERQVEDFHALTGDPDGLRANIDPIDYLSQAMANPDYTVFVGVDETGARQLGADQRRRLDAMGFQWLASIGPGDCYRAVVRDGKVVNEDLSTRADTRLYIDYWYDDYVRPRNAYFQMFKSSDEEAIEALAYATDPEEAEQPVWRLADQGFTVIVYDDSMEAVRDYACFRSWLGLRRYCDPQAVLDGRLAGGAQEWELPWPLQLLKRYDDELAVELWGPPPVETPEEGASAQTG